MAAKFKLKNGPAIITLEEVVIGSQMTPVAVHLRQETSPGSGVMVDMDLTNKTWECHVKDNLKGDVNPDTEITAVARLPLTSGWLDLLLDGTKTGTLKEQEYFASLKVWPTGSPELGDTLLILVLPLKYEATR